MMMMMGMNAAALRRPRVRPHHQMVTHRPYCVNVSFASEINVCVGTLRRRMRYGRLP